MDSQIDWHAARAALEWQVEMGVTETISETPINRFEQAAPPPKAGVTLGVQAPSVPVPVDAGTDPVAEAERAARQAQDLTALQAAMAAYPHCELQKGARNLVFSDGVAGARVMIVGEAPGRDEDRIGKPFVGRAGQLLDRMLAAIDMGRDRDGAQAVYITNVLPWRPPQNRDPKPDEMAMMLPFLKRHIELAQPEVLVVMGNISCQALLGKRGITRLRGQWTEAAGRPVLPMFHPAYLLRNPAAKREAWADLLDLRVRLHKKA
ncbi:uracil-DNA glycosylase [Marivita hallyeonensis]|uniref:Type-4 uracil-DNA glycosylase n=1 Tax=Marivita hallyeonensis TaxID=996342 RepID=A0A1M5TQW0_9RHOB|nr:uracil-DNA glycosylase [Marivita hallyeonensis]SHH53114.1 DNA polymerase [Marivita hallyeonensis]